MKRFTTFSIALLLCATVTAVFFYTRARAATTYTWNQTGTASWALDTNWTPTRTAPAVDDILVFNNAVTSIVTNVPTQTIGQLAVSGINTDVTLQPAAGVLTLTIAGAAGTDLSVAASSALNISGGTTNTNTLKILVAAGATAAIDGTMTFSTAQHQLDAADASGITFSSGAIFSYNPGGTAGNAFTNAGTANAVVFTSGSIYVFQGGANPFGLGQPASKVVFQSGSSFNQQGTGTPSFSGRIYANYTLNNAAAIVTVTGGSAVSLNNLTITAGTLNFNMTATPGHSIKGNISVASGATLNFNPATPGTLNFNSGSGQSISNLGTLTTAANQTFVVTSATSVAVNNNFTLAGIMTVNSGGTLATGATYTNSGTTTINGTFRLQSGGSVLGNAFTYGAASTLHYFGTGTSQTSTNLEWPAASGPTNVTINNSSGVTLHAARTITGTLDLLSGIFATGGQLSMASGSQITKSDGDMTGTPQGAGTYNVVYSGFAKPSGSELDGAGLTNVTVDMVPSQFLILTATRTVPGVLTLMNGLIQTGGNTLIIGSSGSVVRTSGHVVGNLQKTFTAAGAKTFEVGTFFDYSPVSVNATAGTFPANFTVSATIGAMPGISGPNKLGRFWTLANTTVTSANLTFSYLPGDVTGTVANYQFVRKTGGILTVLPPAGPPTSTSATINGVTTFSDWTLAEPSSVTTVLVVNNIGDSGDATPGNGICETGTGNGICTLRAAIQEANGTPFGTGAPIDINFSLGSSLITVLSELQLNHNVNINGPTAASIQVTGSPAIPTRVFHTMPGRTVNISNLTVAGGRAIGVGLAGMGGGLLAEGPVSTTTLTGMLFAGNAAVDTSGLFGGGGAMTVNGGALNIYNSTFSANTGTTGGGIGFQGAGPLVLVNVTATNNFANGDTGAGPCVIDGDGGGIGGPTMPAANISLRNSIVAGNTDCNSDEPNITAAGGFINQGNNLTSGDPMLGPLQNNGGPTFTHALLVLSPAIDSGNDCVFDNSCSPAVGVALTTDQRGSGFTRKADGNSLPPAVVDIGAYEKQTPSAAGGSVTGRIVDTGGQPVAGTALRLDGAQTRLTMSDANGNYRFDEVTAGGFYSVTPSRANFSFAPAQRSFSLFGDNTEAVFTAAASSGTVNPLDTTEYFVRQQYLDFLGREPDEAGLSFWVNNIDSCGHDANCLVAKRVDTSAAFFLSIEFHETGYFAYRVQQSAFGDLPGAPVPVSFADFRADSAVLGEGLVVNAPGWQEKLEANKQAFLAAFVSRTRFMNAYPAALTPAAFVDRLIANAGVVLDANERAAAVAEFAGAQNSADAGARARALRRVAESAALDARERNSAFVLMQYFGYLGRDPNAPPDGNFSGYNFWLNKLESFNGDFRRAEMVRAFLVAGEYRSRFPR